MNLNHEDILDKGGIYKITNCISGKFYIGSTKRFKKRQRDHFGILKRNKHHNKHLQASYNKHGRKNFLFEILEIVEGSHFDRTKIEQKYLNNVMLSGEWDNCFNSQKLTIQTCPQISNMDKHRKKQSLLKKAFYKTPRGKKTIEKIAENRRGKSYEEYYGSVEKAEEIKQKIRENKLVEMNKPEVKEKLKKQLKGKSFEERFGKEKAEIILNKMSKSRKGKYSGKNSSRYKIYNNLLLVSPDGKTYTKVEGVKDFAAKHNLNRFHLCELLKGKRKSCSGWIIKKEIEI
jgi:group I intron endonuclease